MSITAAYWTPFESLAVVRISGETTNGEFAMVEFLIAPGATTPLHVDHKHGHWTYVLEGEVTFHLPDGLRQTGAGDMFRMTTGIPHASCITSQEPARTLELVRPAGLEELLAAFEPATALTLPPAGLDLAARMPSERIAELAHAAGIEVLGPSPFSSAPYSSRRDRDRESTSA